MMTHHERAYAGSAAMKSFFVQLGLTTTLAMGCVEAAPLEGFGGGGIDGEVRVTGIPAGIVEVTAEREGGASVRADVVAGMATLRAASLQQEINLHVGTLTWLHVRGRSVALPLLETTEAPSEVTLDVSSEAAFVAVLGREGELLSTESLALARPNWQATRASTNVPVRAGDVVAWADASMTLGGLARVPDSSLTSGHFDARAMSALTAFAPGLPTAPYGYAAVVGVPGVSKDEAVHVLVPGAWSIPPRTIGANYWAIARTTQGDDSETVMVRDLDTPEHPVWPTWLAPPTLTNVSATSMRMAPNALASLHIVEVFDGDGLREHATWLFGLNASTLEVGLTPNSHYARARAFDVAWSDTRFDADAARHEFVRFADTMLAAH